MILQYGNVFVIICGVLQKLVEPNVPKKSKKKPTGSNQRMESLQKVIGQVVENFKSLEEFIQTLEKSNQTTIEEQLNDLELDENKSELRSLIKDSYEKTFVNLKAIIKTKKEYLKALLS